MKRHILLLIILLAVAGGTRAQEDRELTRLLIYAKHAMLFNQTNPQEKVYLHFDNTAYFKGETMRFKAYVVRADNTRATDISSVLHVELLNPSGDVVERRKLKVENGEAEGDIRLDSIFGTGFYEVRAFTRYMVNWGGDGIFSRVFPIFKKPTHDGDYSNPQIEELSHAHRLPERTEEPTTTLSHQNDKKAASAAAKRDTGKGGLHVSFYPEGGDLVAGLPARVAFSMTDKEGKNVAVKGEVQNQAGQTVARCESDQSGRGSFRLDNVESGELKFVVTDATGKRRTFDLPTAKTEGCAMQLDAVSDSIQMQLYCTPDLEGRLLGLTVINGGIVTQLDTLKAEPQITFGINRSRMRAGVNQLTVFDSRGRVLAERLFFIRPNDSDADSIHVKTGANRLTPCGKVTVDLQAEPNTSISFSAMDAGTLANGHVGNAQTWLLLSSDVRGYIPNPDYYFESDDREHREAADLLMMVQGWRRYDWHLQAGVKGFQDIPGFKGSLQPIEDQLYVFGQLLPDRNKWRKKHPVGGVDLSVFLYNSKGEHMTGSCVTDSLGNYAFKMPDIEGEWNMQIQTKWNDKMAAYVVSVNRHFSPAARILSPYEVEMIPLPDGYKGLQSNKQKGVAETSIEGKLQRRGTGDNSTFVLPTVKVKARYFTDNSHLPWYNEKTGARKSTIFYNVDEATDQINDFGEPLPTLYEWLLGKNEFFGGEATLEDRWNADSTGTLHRMDDPGTTIDQMSNYANSTYKDGLTYKNRPVIWIINNQYVTVTHYLRNTYTIRYTNNPSGATAMPDYIDEVKSVYISEDDDNYTHFIQADELAALHPVTIYVYTHPQFFMKEKGLRRTHFQGFNVPTKFEMEDYSLIPPMDDFRRTLFWAPTVKTDANGHAQVEFFNNSTCNKIYISAEGLRAKGGFAVSE